MTISFLNNRKVKRNFDASLWTRRGVMFPWPNRKYIQIGVFGFVFMIQYGNFKIDW